MRYGHWTSLWRVWPCAAVVGAVLVAPSVARAQGDEPVRYEWSLKAGAFIPTQATLSREAAEPWWYFGADFNPKFRYRPLGGEVYFSLDFSGRDGGGGSYFSIPLSVRVKWPLTPEESSLKAYGGLGVGVFFINTGYSTGSIQPGGKFFLGVDLSEKWFVELNYDWVGGFTNKLDQGIRVDGVTALLGYRL